MRGQKKIKTKRIKKIKGNSWSRKSLEKLLVFIAENGGEIMYSKSCRVGFAKRE